MGPLLVSLTWELGIDRFGFLFGTFVGLNGEDRPRMVNEMSDEEPDESSSSEDEGDEEEEDESSASEDEGDDEEEDESSTSWDEESSVWTNEGSDKEDSDDGINWLGLMKGDKGEKDERPHKRQTAGKAADARGLVESSGAAEKEVAAESGFSRADSETLKRRRMVRVPTAKRPPEPLD